MIPSSFFEHSRGIDPTQVAVISAGVPRSATTWIFQILRDLYPDGGVVKCHRYLTLPESIPAVVTYRDWRDVMVSYWRTLNGDRASQGERMIEEEIYSLFAVVKLWSWHCFLWRSRKNTMVLRYEDFIVDPHSIFPPLGQLLSRCINRRQREELLGAHSLEINRGLKRFTDVPANAVDDWEPGSHTPIIADPHCHEGEVGSWKRFVDEEHAPLVNALFAEMLLDYGYDQ